MVFYFLLAAIVLTVLPFLFWSLPDVDSGFNYVVSVHSADGVDLAEFFKDRRFFVPGRDIPDSVKEAFIAAEDRGFIHTTDLTLRNSACAQRNISAIRL